MRTQDQQTCEQKLGCDPSARCVYDVDRQQSICQCIDGYEGDGRFCTIIIQDNRNLYDTVKECRDQTDCHQNGHCVLRDTEGKYYCECLPGHRGDGVSRCEPSDQCTPADTSSCARDAECAYSSYESAYVCKCVQGYIGDGRTCYPQPPTQPPQAPQQPHIGSGAQPAQPTQPQATTCDQDPRICHVDANCVYNRQESRYSCVCKAEYSGDGYSNCIREASCFLDRSLCDSNAQCVPDGRGFYVCNCNYGYHGNGRVCHSVSEQRSDTLLVGKGMSIIHRSVNPEIIGRQLIVVPHQVVVDIDFDCTNERLYWSDISGHTIRTAALNGTDVKAFFENELKSPEGIAIDWSSRNLYYADSTKDEIGVVSLDGKYQKALLTEGLVNPRAVEIDLNHRHVYYSDWHRETPRIGRIDMDGSNNQVFVNSDIHLPNGLAIVQSRQELCWVDAGSQRLSCIGLDGRNRRVVYAPLEYPFGLTIRNDERFYWTDWKDHKIHSVTIYGADYTSFVPSTGGGGKLYGIISVPSKCHGTASQCTQNNGGCNYLCLPGQLRAKCACPDNVKDLDGC
uniref:EGF-like domain-containing protein n=1 Tax=Acrobeloides nanus TaxID=290746 RepID=A0A914DFS9_9BILA